MLDIKYSQLESKNKEDFLDIQKLVNANLSEPYSVYVYLFFLTIWPKLCFLAKYYDEKSGKEELIGAIICKLEPHRNARMRGYIGMVAVEPKYRGNGIAKKLILKSIEKMVQEGADEIMLETEVVNKAAISLYENMGFIRTKRLYRYYLNQHDAFRLLLPITERSHVRSGYLNAIGEGNSVNGVGNTDTVI
ncbi:peptide alpha-N-acetyltransferase MAK3 [Ascoidea rubescens DSM 1968]|uniref:GAG protein N-acetyltransferase n=1 Tax=Ascoidea rubescens DSM 1968 TaxID=1344418 RepID=A0A1D2VKF0_9ASCO|nr:GAG protein N-acetyltransferase [Ascoidea rubescens DSM 1968]ODV62084.1 GAG protein N-acetyltransferase [Ascoidea rubescens DSM 1968]